MSEWWEAFEKRKCEVDKLKDLPDDPGALQVDVEKYIVGKKFGLKPKCKLKNKTSVPGTVLLLGHPKQALGPTGKVWPKYVSAEILNGKIDGTAFAKLGEEFIKNRPESPKPHEPTFFSAQSDTMKDFFETCEARCNNYDKEDKAFWFGGGIMVNAYVDKSHSTGGVLIHEIFHAYEGGDEPANVDDFGQRLDEGFVDYFAREFAATNTKWGKHYKGQSAYNTNVAVVTDVMNAAGAEKCFQLWFTRTPEALKKVQASALALNEDLYKKDPKSSGGTKNICDPHLVEAFVKAIKTI